MTCFIYIGTNFVELKIEEKWLKKSPSPLKYEFGNMIGWSLVKSIHYIVAVFERPVLLADTAQKPHYPQGDHHASHFFKDIPTC